MLLGMRPRLTVSAGIRWVCGVSGKFTRRLILASPAITPFSVEPIRRDYEALQGTLMETVCGLAEMVSAVEEELLIDVDFVQHLASFSWR